MKADVTEVAPCRRKIAVEVPAEQVDASFEEMFNSVRQRVNIKGFRRGHAPRRVLEKRFGEDIARDVRGKLFQTSFMECLKEKDLTPLGEPDLDLESIDVKPGAPFSYTTEIDVQPEFELPVYKNLKLTDDSKPADDSEVQAQMDRMRESFATYNEIEDGFQEGDFVTGDITLLADGKEVANRPAQRIPGGADRLLGIECADLASQFAGAKPGEERDIALNAPEEYHIKEAAGKSVTAHIKMTKIERADLPELDDEFVQRLGLESVDQLKERIRESIDAEHKNAARAAMQEQAVDQLLDTVDFPLPESFVEQQVAQRTMQQRAMFESMADQKPEDAEERIKTLEEEARKEVERGARRMILFDRIASEEKIEISEEDVRGHIQRLAMAYRTTPQEMLKRIQELNGFNQIAQEIRDIKVCDYLVDNADITKENAADGE